MLLNNVIPTRPEDSPSARCYPGIVQNHHGWGLYAGKCKSRRNPVPLRLGGPISSVCRSKDGRGRKVCGGVSGGENRNFRPTLTPVLPEVRGDRGFEGRVLFVHARVPEWLVCTSLTEEYGRLCRSPSNRPKFKAQGSFSIPSSRIHEGAHTRWR